MEEIEEFVDERQNTWCIHCARQLAGLDVNEDHVPSQSLLRKPRPHHLPVVVICEECNVGFSLDEQYAMTFLSCVLAGSVDPEKQSNESAARALTDSPALRTQIGRLRSEYVTPGGETRVLWKPDIDRIERVVLKNARGHAYFELGEPKLKTPKHIGICPLESMTSTVRHDFSGPSAEGCLAPWPEAGSRMMTRFATGEGMMGEWVIVQEGIYRYSVRQAGDLLVKSVLSEYLATEVLWED